MQRAVLLAEQRAEHYRAKQPGKFGHHSSDNEMKDTFVMNGRSTQQLMVTEIIRTGYTIDPANSVLTRIIAK